MGPVPFWIITELEAAIMIRFKFEINIQSNNTLFCATANVSMFGARHCAIIHWQLKASFASSTVIMHHA